MKYKSSLTARLWPTILIAFLISPTVFDKIAIGRKLDLQRMWPTFNVNKVAEFSNGLRVFSMEPRTTSSETHNVENEVYYLATDGRKILDWSIQGSTAMARVDNGNSSQIRVDLSESITLKKVPTTSQTETDVDALTSPVGKKIDITFSQEPANIEQQPPTSDSFWNSRFLNRTPIWFKLTMGIVFLIGIVFQIFIIGRNSEHLKRRPLFSIGCGFLGWYFCVNFLDPLASTDLAMVGAMFLSGCQFPAFLDKE